MDKKQKQLAIHLGLFIVTLVTTTIAGTEWMLSKYLFWVDDPAIMGWNDFLRGFEFSIPFLLILTVHEFGHYFTAKHHGIAVTLPYYIPFWLGFILSPSFGTMGAFIRIKDPIYRLKHYFDVGISGPLAGFVVALFVIWYGFSNLPEPEYIFQIHPEYAEYGMDYADHVYQDNEYATFQFGDNLIFSFFKTYVADPERLPHPNEIIHYPLILAGYLALFFTALNLLPIGQLDGGHIVFGMFGPKKHFLISRILFALFLFYAGLGLVSMDDLPDPGVGSTFSYLLLIAAYLYFLYVCAFSMFDKKSDRWTFAAVLFATQFVVNTFIGLEGYTGWLLFALLIGRFLGVKHPPVLDHTPLSTDRKILGWVALVVFVLCFSPEPFVLEFPEP